MSELYVEYPHQDLSIDQQLALRTAAARLATEFDGTYGRETIERFLHTSYDQFASLSTVPNFLPLLAERFARQRLQALARVEGRSGDGRPVVLFLCTHNAGRSQMALGFFTHLAGDAAVAWSSGSRARRDDQPVGDRGDGRTRHRHFRRVSEAVDRRGGPRGRRGGHHGLRRRLPCLPPASGTKIGTSPTRQAWTSRLCARSGTIWNAACAGYSTS